MNTIYEPTSIRGTIEQGISYAKNRVAGTLYYIIKERQERDLDGFIDEIEAGMAENINIASVSRYVAGWAYGLYEASRMAVIAHQGNKPASANITWYKQ